MNASERATTTFIGTENGISYNRYDVDGYLISIEAVDGYELDRAKRFPRGYRDNYSYRETMALYAKLAVNRITRR